MTREDVIRMATSIEYERGELRKLEQKVATKKRRIAVMERDFEQMIATIKRAK